MFHNSATSVHMCYERAVEAFREKKRLRTMMPTRTQADRRALTLALTAVDAAWWDAVAPLLAREYAQFREEQYRLSQEHYLRLQHIKESAHVSNAATTAEPEP